MQTIKLTNQSNGTPVYFALDRFVSVETATNDPTTIVTLQGGTIYVKETPEQVDAILRGEDPPVEPSTTPAPEPEPTPDPVVPIDALADGKVLRYRRSEGPDNSRFPLVVDAFVQRFGQNADGEHYYFGFIVSDGDHHTANPRFMSEWSGSRTGAARYTVWLLEDLEYAFDSVVGEIDEQD